MKVTIVVGGRWHAFDLARELERSGHLHRLITNYPKWFASKWEIPSKKIVSLPLTFIAVRLIYKLGGEHLMMRCQWVVHQWFAKRASRHLEGSDLIHGWSSWSEPSMRWANERKIPFVLERSSAHILKQSELLREEHRRLGFKWVATHPKIEEMEIREYALATKIATPSLFVERSFLERGFPPSMLIRNNFGVDLTLFTPCAEMKPPRDGFFNIVYAGAISVQKGVHDLIEGFKLAEIAGSTLTLLGGLTKEMTPLLLSQPESIRLLGHRPQEELARHYREGHCFVMPSIQEGMAMVQIQALACGLPLICSTNSGGEDLLQKSGRIYSFRMEDVQEFGAGFVVPVNNPEAIAICLNFLATEKGLWERKRESALQLAQERLNWKDYAFRAINEYKEILEGSGSNLEWQLKTAGENN